jgi:DNA-binding transcriptional regulator YhcF (GntR family)
MAVKKQTAGLDGAQTKYKHLPVKEDIKLRILRGDFKEFRIPTRFVLAEHYGISPTTAAAVVKELENEEIIYKRTNNTGFFVHPFGMKERIKAEFKAKVENQLKAAIESGRAIGLSDGEIEDAFMCQLRGNGA